MIHRDCEAMKRDRMARLQSRRVVADETYIGGILRNPQGGTNIGGIGVQGQTRQDAGHGAGVAHNSEIHVQLMRTLRAPSFGRP